MKNYTNNSKIKIPFIPNEREFQRFLCLKPSFPKMKPLANNLINNSKKMISFNPLFILKIINSFKIIYTQSIIKSHNNNPINISNSNNINKIIQQAKKCQLF